MSMAQEVALMAQHEPGPDSAAASGNEEAPARVAHGNVVNVRTIPARSVTRVEIELPIEFHVEATSLLFGKDVLIVGVKLPKAIPYGITDGAPGVDLQSARRPASARPPSSVRAPVHGGLGHIEDGVDIAKWLGARCTEEPFQIWLGVRTEAGAASKVRALCGVRSRADIARSPKARAAFFEKIHRPFVARQSREAQPAPVLATDPVLAAGPRELGAAS